MNEWNLILTVSPAPVLASRVQAFAPDFLAVSGANGSGVKARLGSFSETDFSGTSKQQRAVKRPRCLSGLAKGQHQAQNCGGEEQQEKGKQESA